VRFRILLTAVVGLAIAACSSVLADSELWVQRYNGPTPANDQATAIARDTEGNVMVVGIGTNDQSHTDWVIVKYDSGGNHLWTQRCYSTGLPAAIAVDLEGDVYVAGYCVSITGWDCMVVKYDKTGSQCWVRTYSSGGCSR
jgi:hypothetical protein